MRLHLTYPSCILDEDEAQLKNQPQLSLYMRVSKSLGTLNIDVLLMVDESTVDPERRESKCRVVFSESFCSDIHPSMQNQRLCSG